MSDIAAPPDAILERIRFALSGLRARNGHHDFEHICRYIAQARIIDTVLPSTGPVGAGGDQGRDFESFRTYLASRMPNSFVGLGKNVIIAGACTLQVDKVPEKIRSDIATIVAGANVDTIYVFCQVDLPVATRHRIAKWANEQYDASVEIIDGNAIAELLLQDDLYWVAQRYLGQPAKRSPGVSKIHLLREITADERLPTLEDLSDDALGVTPTRYTKTETAPYVARPAVDGLLRTNLAIGEPPHPFVVLVGNSKAGKSRTLSEAVRTVFKNTPVILPKSGQALESIAGRGPEGLTESSHVLVWLDDLTAGLLGHLSGGVLNKLEQWATIVGTITSRRYEEVLYSGAEIAGTARAALSRANTIELAFNLTGAEADEARRLYPAEDFVGSVAETLVAGEALLAKLKAGGASSPFGVAVAHAVIDWRRSGVDRPIRRSELVRLFPTYLKALSVNLEASPTNFCDGLAWATAPVASQVALIGECSYERPALDDPDDEEIMRYRDEELGLCDEKGWMALDYIVSSEDEENSCGREIPDTAWRQIAEMLDPPDMHGVVLSAHARGRFDIAEAILYASMDASRDDLKRGSYYESAGEYVKAEQIYCAAIDSGDVGKMSEGRAMLGMMLHSLGRQHEAAANLSRITDFSTVYGSVGGIHLGVYLEEDIGDLNAADEVYSALLERGHKRIVPTAAQRLGHLRLIRGDTEGAIQPLNLALEKSRLCERAELLLFLAKTLQAAGKLSDAEVAAAESASLSGPDLGFYSWGLLGEIREELGDRRGAIRAYDKALTFEGPE